MRKAITFLIFALTVVQGIASLTTRGTANDDCKDVCAIADCTKPNAETLCPNDCAATGYSTISSSYFCAHVDGGYPNFCLKSSISNCEARCTSFEWCVAYGKGSFGNNCALITSSGACPDDWSFRQVTGSHFAKSASDLTASTQSGLNCMAKLSGDTPACSQTSDCPNGQYCDNGLCKAWKCKNKMDDDYCDSTWSCKYPMFVAMCQKLCGACAVTGTCTFVDGYNSNSNTEEVGTATNDNDCANLVRIKKPYASGATRVVSTDVCFADFGVIGTVYSSKYRSCQFSDPTCSDGIQNQREEAVDCGGPCTVCETQEGGLCDAGGEKAPCVDGLFCVGETSADYGRCRQKTD